MEKAGQLYPTEGSTATTALLQKDRLHVAYVGDSAAVLISKDGVKTLCAEKDSAEENKTEVERIEKAGGVVLKVGSMMRVQGELMLTRALGDAKYKSFVIPEPHIVEVDLSKEKSAEYVVLATDGLWGSMSAEEVAGLVHEQRESSESEIAEYLYKQAVEKGSMDNVTVAVINIKKRKNLMAEGAYTQPPAPTSKYASQKKKAFLFS